MGVLLPKVEGDFGLLIAGPTIYLPAAEATNAHLGILDSSLAALRGWDAGNHGGWVCQRENYEARVNFAVH